MLIKKPLTDKLIIAGMDERAASFLKNSVTKEIHVCRWH